MPLPSRKELTAQLQSALGALLEKYTIEGKKSRKLTEKAAGKLAKALKKNAGKQELKKASAKAESEAGPKKAKKLKKNNPGKDAVEEKVVSSTAQLATAGQKAGKTENNKKTALTDAS